MSFLFALIFFVVAVMLINLGSWEWYIVLTTFVGFLFGKVLNLSKELKQLRQTMADDWERRNSVSNDNVLSQTIANQGATTAPSSDIASTDVTNSGIAGKTPKQALNEKPQQLNETDYQQEEYLDAITQAAAYIDSDKSVSQKTLEPSIDKIAVESTVDSNTVNQTSINDEKQSAQSHIKQGQTNQTQRSPENLSKIPVKSNDSDPSSLITRYFTGGNLFVRIGIIILFFGVSFLLKYVSDQGYLPIEYRLMGVVLGAMVLLGLGWRLRRKNETYALMLQGAGIGVLYLDIFAAYNLYQLIPALATFALLFVVSMFSAALAVLQNSKSLAVLGFSGGFIAPILASSGSNNHVGLFSYYVILNVAIVVIAWFKAWRELNLLGFVFTFIIGTTWGVLSYNSEKFFTTEPFLILFFIFYVLIAVFYALRQPPKLRGYVDGTLLFGVPLAASSLQYYLVKDFEYGVSVSSFVMGAFYILLSWFIWKRKGEGLKLLSEAFLAIGVIFASMAIPFALAPTQTAAAWALEGVGLIWLGTRQNRVSVRAFGVLLQIAAGIIFLSSYELVLYQQEPTQDQIQKIIPFINGEFISALMLAVGGIISARLLIKSFTGQQDWEKGFSPALLIWGLLWLVGGFTYQVIEYLPDLYMLSIMLVFASFLGLFLGLLATRCKPLWKHAFIAAFATFVIVSLMALTLIAMSQLEGIEMYYPSMFYGWIAWPIVFLSYYFILFKAEKYNLFSRYQSFFHTVLILLMIVLVTFELVSIVTSQLELSAAWMSIVFVIPATLAIWVILKTNIWPFNTHRLSYGRYAGSILAFVLGIWSLVALVNRGASDPLPWMPVLNPLDIMVIIVFITLFKWRQTLDKSVESLKSQNEKTMTNESPNKDVFVIGFATLTFLWVNFTLFRIAHHWFAVPYIPRFMFESDWVQTSISILWALTGVILTVYSSHKNHRLLWMIGAFLLGLVVLKLFTIDLSALGSLGTIVSFIVVGLLLTSIGYFAPIPDKEEDGKGKGRSSKGNLNTNPSINRDRIIKKQDTSETVSENE